MTQGPPIQPIHSQKPKTTTKSLLTYRKSRTFCRFLIIIIIIIIFDFDQGASGACFGTRPQTKMKINI